MIDRGSSSLEHLQDMHSSKLALHACLQQVFIVKNRRARHTHCTYDEHDGTLYYSATVKKYIPVALFRILFNALVQVGPVCNSELGPDDILCASRRVRLLCLIRVFKVAVFNNMFC